MAAKGATGALAAPALEEEAPVVPTFEDGATLTVLGEGGDVFDMDVPTSGTIRREIFDEFIRKGWLVVQPRKDADE